MYFNKLKSLCITLVISAFFLTSCNWEPDITFPDIFNDAYHGYYGNVIDNNTLEPLSDARITWNNQIYESNSEGFFEINNLPDDFEATIKVSKEGYEDYFHTVRIKRDETQNLNIFMIPVKQELY